MTDTNENGGQVRPFAAVLQDIDNGQVSERLATDVQALVTAVLEQNRKGSITLKLEVAPRKGNAHALNVAARVETRLPAPEPVESVFFTDRSGNLHRDDPMQMSIPLRQVGTPEINLDELRRAGQ
jgi:hypothetical protein